MAAIHTSKIEFTVGLDENKVPEKLHWTLKKVVFPTRRQKH